MRGTGHSAERQHGRSPGPLAEQSEPRPIPTWVLPRARDTCGGARGGWLILKGGRGDSGEDSAPDEHLAEVAREGAVNPLLRARQLQVHVLVHRRQVACAGQRAPRGKSSLTTWRTRRSDDPRFVTAHHGQAAMRVPAQARGGASGRRANRIDRAIASGSRGQRTRLCVCALGVDSAFRPLPPALGRSVRRCLGMRHRKPSARARSRAQRYEKGSPPGHATRHARAARAFAGPEFEHPRCLGRGAANRQCCGTPSRAVPQVPPERRTHICARAAAPPRAAPAPRPDAERDPRCKRRPSKRALLSAWVSGASTPHLCTPCPTSAWRSRACP